MQVLLIDPPEGWNYGFPKQVHDEYHLLGEDFDLNRWLVSEGYPQRLIDQFDGDLPCRFFYKEI